MSSEQAGEDQALWDGKASEWDRHIGADGDRNRRENVHPVLWRMLGDVAERAVLDAGCGTGYLSVKLALAGARVTAVDYAPAMVEVARRRAREAGVSVDLRVDDCVALDTVATGSVERLVSNYVLQDLADLRGAVRAFRRVLRSGGEAVLVFAHPCFGPPGGPEDHADGSFSYRWPFPYFDEVRCEERWAGRDVATGERFDFPGRFTFYHRPLSAYWRAFADHGLRCLDFDEPVLQEPYPPGVTPADVARSRRCAYSVAFQLRAE